MSKKGGIPQPIVVGFLVLVASLIVILIFWASLFSDGPTKIDRASCESSISLRHSVNLGAIDVGKRIIPLRCKTEKFCVTDDKENCEEQFGKISSDEIFERVDTPDDSEDIKDIALGTLSEAVFTCNHLLGSGEKDFFPDSFTGNNYCVVCSRVAFDDETYQVVKDLQMEEFYEVLDDNITSQGDTYLQRVYKINDPVIIPALLDALKNTDEFKDLQEEKISGDVSLDHMLVFPSKDNAIIAQIHSQNRGISFIESLFSDKDSILLVPKSSMVAAGFPIGLDYAGLFVIDGKPFGGLLFAKNTPSDNRFVSPIIVPNDATRLRELGCTDFEGSP